MTAHETSEVHTLMIIIAITALLNALYGNSRSNKNITDCRIRPVANGYKIRPAYPAYETLT